MIEIIDLRDKIPEDILPLITAEACGFIEAGDAVGIGIYSDDKPVGVISAYLGDGAGVINHIFVDPEYRRQGLGTELVYRLALLLSSFNSMYRLEAEFTDQSDVGLEGFFSSLDFDIEEEEDTGEYVISLGDAVGAEVFAKARTDGVASLGRIQTSQRNALIESHPDVEYFKFMGELQEKMSCVVLEKEEDKLPEAQIFFADRDNELIMIWAESGDKNMALLSMLRFAINEAIKEYDANKIIRIPYINEVSRKIIEKIMGDFTRTAYHVKHAVYGLGYTEESA